MWNLISTRSTQFCYFDTLLGSPAWKGRKILDLGGNVGTFLAGAGDAVNHEDYWCVDLNRKVIQYGRSDYPRAHFVHYDRFSTQYNPDGVRHLPIPDCGVKFDFALAFSVFTHVHRDEVLELVGQLRNMLKAGGTLAFTFCDARFDRSLTDSGKPSMDTVAMIEKQRRDQGITENEVLARARESDWFLQIDNDVYVEPGPEFCHQERLGRPRESYCSFFSTEYMQSLFPGGKVLPPVEPEWQHCCVLHAP